MAESDMGGQEAGGESTQAGDIKPSEFPLLASSYARAGSDLAVHAPDGETFVIRGFFDHSPSDLVRSDGARLSGSLFARLPDAGTWKTGNELLGFTQASVGVVDQVSGPITVVRQDGTMITYASGDAILKGDVVIAGPDARLTLQLDGGTRVVMGERAHLSLRGYDSAQGVFVLRSDTGAFSLMIADGISAHPVLFELSAARVRLDQASLAVRQDADGQLEVTVLDVASTHAAVRVENDHGFVDLDPGQAAQVDGPDEPPRAAMSEASAARNFEVSPGGDPNAVVDVIKVTEGLPTFDLKPEPAPLADTVAIGSAPAAGASTDVQHNAASFYSLSVASAAGLDAVTGNDVSANAADVSGAAGSGRRKLTGWEPLGLEWDIFGTAETEGTMPEAQNVLPFSGLPRTISRTEGALMAYLEVSPEGTGPIESFLELAPNRLTEVAPGVARAGASAIATNITLKAGDELSFDWFFDPANQTLRGDYAAFIVGGQVFKLADASETTKDGATGWRTSVFRITAGGTYWVGYAVVNDRTPDDPSHLFVDNVRINRVLGDDLQLLSEQTGGLRTYVPAPVTQADALTVGEDAPVTVAAGTLLANDFDPDTFNAMRIVGVNTTGTYGFVRTNSNVSVTYDPAHRFDYLAEGQTASDIFQYIVNDGAGIRRNGTVQVTIIGANDAPIAASFSAADSGAENGAALSINPLIKAVDVDNDDDPSTLRIVSAQASTGSISVTGQGTGLSYSTAGRFEYLAVGETAVDTISYVITDRHGARSSGTVTVTVAGANDAPVARTDVTQIDEDSSRTIDVIVNDSDIDVSDTLTVSRLAGVPVTSGGGNVMLPSGAAVSVDAQGHVVFDARGAFDRLAKGETAIDAFSYEIADGNGGFSTSTVTVTVEGRNDAPTAVADAARTTEDGPAVAVAALANDVDVDSDDDASTLHVVSAHADSGTVSWTGQPGEGLAYDPSGHFESLAEGETATDTVHYVVADRYGATGEGIVTVTVEGTNDAPVAVADALHVSEDAPAEVDALANDSDVDHGDRIGVVAVNGMPSPTNRWILPSGAVVSLDVSGQLTYDPAGRFESLSVGETASDGFVYRIADKLGATAEATVTVTVEGRNDPPTANADFDQISEDGVAPDDPRFRFGGLLVDPLANDDDIDSDDEPADLRLVEAHSTAGAEVVLTKKEGSEQNGETALIYTPSAMFNYLGAGEVAIDTIVYTARDTHGATATGTVTMSIVGANDAPIAADDKLLTSADVRISLNATLGLLGNDHDPDRNDTMRIAAINGVAAGVGAPIVLASGAVLQVMADGSVSYDPRSSETFQALQDFEFFDEQVSYTIADASGATSTASVRIRVLGKNDAPVAQDDTVITDADAAVRIAALVNDHDPDAGDTVRITDFEATTAQGAKVRLNPDGTFTYDPNGQFDTLAAGSVVVDHFRYTIDDFAGAQTSAVVSVQVVGTAHDTGTGQQLLQSFETQPIAAGNWKVEGGITAASSVTAGQLWAPTHLETMAVLQSAGASAQSISALLSDNHFVDGLPLLKLPKDSDTSSAVSGSAVTEKLAIGQSDIQNSKIIVSFDWNFISGEPGVSVNGRNDFAVVSVTDGSSYELFRLADARGTTGTSGWRTSILDLSNFLRAGQAQATLTVGFAVFDDQEAASGLAGPSKLLLDNIRLNRTLDGHFEVVSTQAGGTLQTYRERPSPVDDTLAQALSEDQSTTVSVGSVLANDRTSAGIAASTLSVLSVDGSTARGGVSLTAAGIVYDARGRFDQLAEGQTADDAFTYRVGDGNGGWADATVRVTVSGMNDAPSAQLDLTTATENGATVAIDVLANDDDVDSDDDRSTLRIIGATSASGAAVTFSGAPGAGVVYQPNTTLAFEALGAGETMTDMVTYTVEDRHGARTTGSVQVTLTGRNDAPMAAPDYASTISLTAVTINVLANDTDEDRTDHLTIGSIDGHTVSAGSTVHLASGADVIVVDPAGSLRYVPGTSAAQLAQGQIGTDQFHYSVVDGHGGASDALVTLTITGLNDSPVANADQVQMSAVPGLSIRVADLLVNDTDVDAGDAVHVTSVDAVSAAGVSISFYGTNIGYDPSVHYRYLGVGETATDTFTYRIADQSGSTTAGTVTVTVTVAGINDSPDAVNDVANTDEDAPISINLIVNDTDPDLSDRAHLTVTAIDTSHTTGHVTLNPDGTVTYDPRVVYDSLNAGQAAVDSFSYQISDGHGGIDTATVTVNVAGKSNQELLIESFENGVTFERSSSNATIASTYSEPDGVRGVYAPTDGSSMVVMEAFGKTTSLLESFLQLGGVKLPKDTVAGDTSSPANGSAIKMSISVAAGDEVSFDWMFDSREATTPLGKCDNDYAALAVVGPSGTDVFRLADSRQLGDHGATGWRSSIYKATAEGTLTVGFVVLNDNAPDASRAEDSYLLVDNVRINRDFSVGYQSVDHQTDHFSTVVHV